MKLLNGGNIKRVPIADVIIGEDRQRGVGEAQVENLMLMAEDS
ncbi:hypothetical protein [Ruegeria sp. Ofav3-42]|nr:hypothetical protein [Ruegeria sp. Ofav3-42]